MRSRDQVIWDFVQSWLKKAEGDLRAASFLSQESGDRGDMIGSHCQQAVEKLKKAFLVRHQIEFRKIHDLALAALQSYLEAGRPKAMKLTIRG